MYTFDTGCVRVGESAAAIMDGLHSQGLAEEFYKTRENWDGFTGMWVAVSQVAMALELKQGDLWASEQRDYIADIMVVPRLLLKFTREVKLIETLEDAKQFTEWLYGGDYQG